MVVLILGTNVGTFALATGQIPLVRDYVRPQLPGDMAQFDQLYRVMQLIKDRYVDQVSDATLVEGAKTGMVAALKDPPSYYLSPTAMNELLIDTSGTYAGVGVEVYSSNDYIEVIAPIEGTPAEKAGILPKDKIIKVDGKDIVGVSTDEVVNLIRGTPGTKVTLTIFRTGVSEPFDKVITRAQIELKSIYSKLLSDKIGYIRITQFSENSTKPFTDALTTLKGQGMAGLIIDLRNDPGGSLQTCEEIAAQILPSGPIIHQVDRSGNKQTATAPGPGLKIPVVVLINEGSASASEILAGAIQDAGMGALVGTKSYGKGSVQTIFPQPGNTGVKITTARYLTRNEKPVDKIGLTPDYEVKMATPKEGEPIIKLDDPTNPQLAKAIEVMKNLLKLKK
jgi:carboxyl-terminal processing protease